MKNFKLVVISLIVGLLPTIANSQNLDSIALFSKYTTEGVALKIAPQMAQTWLLGAENGYQIYRMELGVDKDYKLLNTTPLKPFMKEDYAKMENGDSVQALNQKAIFDNIAKSKTQKTAFERVQFAQNLQNEYGFYFLITTRIREISMSSGLEFLDKTATKDRIYSYKVKIANDSKNRIGFSEITTVDLQLPVAELLAVNDEKAVHFKWAQSAELNPIISYNLEKSADGENFSLVNIAPFYFSENISQADTNTNSTLYINFTTDSLSENYTPFYYRLVGIDVWGQEHKSSQIVKAMGVDKTPVPAPKHFKTTINEDAKSITFSWETTMASDLKGYNIFLSNDPKNDFRLVNQELMDPANQAYTIKDATPDMHYYIKVATIDTAGNEDISTATYGYLPDIYPPLTPENLQATIDTLGILTLSWNKHPEQNIRGFNIFTTNRKDGKWIQQNQMLIKDTFLIDTVNLNSLLQRKYYTIAAVDEAFNTSTKASAIQVQLPDIVKPLPPSIANVTTEKQAVNLLISPSGSSDVKEIAVYRRQAGAEDWTLATSLSPTAQNFSENLPTGSVEYSLAAIDSSGNESEKSQAYIIDIKSVDNEVVFSAFNVKKQKTSITLSWATSIKAKNYIIYRIDGKKVEKLAVVQSAEYTDKGAEKGKNYQYQIFAQNEKGKLFPSEVSKKVSF